MVRQLACSLFRCQFTKGWRLASAVSVSDRFLSIREELLYHLLLILLIHLGSKMPPSVLVKDDFVVRHWDSLSQMIVGSLIFAVQHSGFAPWAVQFNRTFIVHIRRGPRARDLMVNMSQMIIIAFRFKLVLRFGDKISHLSSSFSADRSL